MADISRIDVKFAVEGLGFAKGELVRFLSPRTIDGILRRLPLEGRAALSKEEVYFKVSFEAGPEKPKPRVETGAIAYWPMGSAICVFYGETQPYTPVNLLGSITENLDLFKDVKEGTRITIQRF